LVEHRARLVAGAEQGHRQVEPRGWHLGVAADDHRRRRVVGDGVDEGDPPVAQVTVGGLALRLDVTDSAAVPAAVECARAVYGPRRTSGGAGCWPLGICTPPR